MKKLVIKVRIKGRDEFEEKLDKLGRDLGAIFWQHDRIYIPRGYKRGQNYPRFVLRTEMRAVDRPAKYFLVLKRHIEDSGIEIENITQVKDYTEAVQMVMQLGFTLQGEVSKRRQETKLREGKMLFLDKIEGVAGFFAKIEMVVPEGAKIETTKEEILETFNSLKEGGFIEKTYAEILRG